MSKLQLSAILAANDRSRPLLDGSVRPEGIDLLLSAGHPSEIFWRQLRFAEFDVSDLSLSSLLMTIAAGESPWLALPVFTTRRFFHTGLLVRRDAGIERPEDLRGRRVGVPEYQQTSALWTRGVLQHEFGVRPEELDWRMERSDALSHGGALDFQPPPGVRFQLMGADQTIASMLIAGELDATFEVIPVANLIDRSGVNLASHPRVRPLFPDPAAEGRRYNAKTGLFPMSHTIVVRRSVVERQPWVALNLYAAFLAAKEQARERLRQATATHLQIGLLPAGSAEALALDPFPYGIRENRQALELLLAYSHEQGLTPRLLRLEDVFATATLDL